MTTTAVSHELVELAHDLARAVSEHDVARLDQLLAAEFTLQGAAGPARPRSSSSRRRPGRTRSTSSPTSRSTPRSMAIRPCSSRATRQVAGFEGRNLTHRMHVTDIWTRRDARWQVVRRHATIAE